MQKGETVALRDGSRRTAAGIEPACHSAWACEADTRAAWCGYGQGCWRARGLGSLACYGSTGSKTGIGMGLVLAGGAEMAGGPCIGKLRRGAGRPQSLLLAAPSGEPNSVIQHPSRPAGCRMAVQGLSVTDALPFLGNRRWMPSPS